MDDEILIKIGADLKGLKDAFSDNSQLWDKHNQEVAKGEKAIKSYGDTVVNENKKVEKAIQGNIDKVGQEGKAIQEIEKKFENLSKKNAQSFDTKKLEQFNDMLKKVSVGFAGIENLNINDEDLKLLSLKLNEAQDDFEALNVLVGFFDDKMKGSQATIKDTFTFLEEQIKLTKESIKASQDFLKEADKKIAKTAPGQDQANLISERKEEAQALTNSQIALEGYQNQLKKVKEESLSMTVQLRKVKEELIQLELSGQRGGARWIELSEDAKKYNTAIRDTNAELARTSKSTAGLDNLIGAATGIVGLFTAAQGAAALFGNESKDLQKTLVKLTGAIALLNGLQQVQTEISKKGTLSNRALTIVQGQYAIATNASATATMRLVAASKLLGIGLLIAGLSLIVTYWKDISKFIGLTSEKTERLTAINKKANDAYSEQIAKLKILVDRVKEGGLSFDEKKKSVKEFNDVFGKTLGTVKDFNDLEKKLIENGAKYIQYLQLKARAEAAYQLQIEKVKEALIKRTEVEAGPLDFAKAIFGSKTPNEYASDSANKDADKLEKDADRFGDILNRTQKEMEALSKTLGIVLDEPKKDLSNSLKDYVSLLETLVKRTRDLKNDLIQDDRERDKSILTDQLNAEKEKYKKEIESLKISNAKKLELLQEYNKIYNDETGLAYEQYRKNISEIDKKYDQQLENVRFNALSAIAEVYGTGEQLELQAIDNKFVAIRAELQKQIDSTKDFVEKQELQAIFDFSFKAQEDEKDFKQTDQSFDRLDREQQIADSVLKIYQANARDIIDNEELKKLQLLRNDKDYLDKVLNLYRSTFKDIEDKNLFDELTERLKNSTSQDEIKAIGEQLREAFGDKTANEILETVAALREVSAAIEDISEKTGFEKLVDDFGKWTNTLESFSQQLAKTLGLQGKAAKEFADGVGVAIMSTWESLQTIFDLEIEEHKNKVDSFQDSINAIESELEREKKLYEEGYANNYDEREKDLENQKAQKKQEEEELKKAQKRKAVLAKSEMLIDTVSQLGNMITASTNIFKWASKIPFIGVPLAIGLIGTMFGAFAVAKTKAYQAIGQGQNFRRGLGEGSLKLSGPRHEERGFGLYNSKSGERVAEFEDGEEILISNRQQSKKYRHIIDALIADAQGRGNIDSTLEGYYGSKSAGKQTMKAIRHVNNVTVITQSAKENASKNNDSLISEIKEFKETFKREFEGYKKERDNEVQSWETPKHFYVKKLNTTKKYTKE